MRNKLIFIAALIVAASCSTKVDSPRRLQYKDDGTFRIVQLADLHLAKDHWSNFMVWDNLENVMATQSPDLLVLTGDNVYSSPVEDIFTELLDSLDATGVPYTFIFGNHDRQFDLGGEELLNLARRRERCLVGDVEHLTGEGTYALELFKGDSLATVLYFFDSGDTSPLAYGPVPEYDYGYVAVDGIAWYEAESRRYAEAAGGTPVNSLAFLHIPFPEYKEITDYEGVWGEPVCSSHLNSGLFCKMLEMGDVRAVFCGHDHDNDYEGDLYGVHLAYGRYSGGKAEYNNLEPNGVRVIELQEFGRDFSTWIALSDGSELPRRVNTGK